MRTSTIAASAYQADATTIRLDSGTTGAGLLNRLAPRSSQTFAILNPQEVEWLLARTLRMSLYIALNLK